MHDNWRRGKGMEFSNPTPLSQNERFAEIADVVKREFYHRAEVNMVHVDTNLKRINIVFADGTIATLTASIGRSF